MQPELSLVAFDRQTTDRSPRRQRSFSGTFPKVFRSCRSSHVANLLIADPIELRHLKYPIPSDRWARHAAVRQNKPVVSDYRPKSRTALDGNFELNGESDCAHETCATALRTMTSKGFNTWQACLSRHLQELAMTAAISFWVAQIIGNSMGTMLALCLLCHPLACLPAAVFLLLQVAIVVLPVGEAPVLIQRAIHFSVQSALTYFSCRVTVEDADALKPGQAYVVGLEPHSALPVALPMVFTDHCDLLPKGLRGIKILAHTAALYMPATRHFWWWLGVRPIDKANIHKLLAANNSVVLVPGGVSECMVMKQGQEVMYLRKRLGFVRLALNHGAPLVPAFAFGQSDTYSWIRPGPQYVVDFFRRVLGFVPLLMWGIWYSAVPYKVPVHVVIGTPVLLPQMDNPTDEEVQQYLDMYITAMEKLCERYKHETGHGDMQFQVV